MNRAYWERELEGLSTTGAINFGCYCLETYSSTQQDLALFTTDSECISTKDVAHVQSALAECDVTLKMRGETDVTAGRAMAARRGVGRVRHVDVRLSWLQLWADGVVHVCLRSSLLGDHNEADLLSKKIRLYC